MAILGAPFDSSIGLGRHGARYGPRGLREASCHFAAFYCSMPDRTLVDLDLGQGFRIPDDLPLVDLGDVDCFPLDIDATTTSVAAGVRSVVETGALPFLLGGDHYLVYPSFKGAAEALRASDPDVRIGLLHIDSHTDLFDEMIFNGRFNNGTSVRRITESPGISIPHMAWIGLNGRLVSKEQYDFAASNHLKLITSASVSGDGWQEIVEETIAAVSEADRVYVSIDIDVVDGAGPRERLRPYSRASPLHDFSPFSRWSERSRTWWPSIFVRSPRSSIRLEGPLVWGRWALYRSSERGCSRRSTWHRRVRNE